jgi:hypothetical protein
VVVVLVEECNAFELIFSLCIVSTKKSKDELQIFVKFIYFYFLVLARWVEDHC